MDLGDQTIDREKNGGNHKGYHAAEDDHRDWLDQGRDVPNGLVDFVFIVGGDLVQTIAQGTGLLSHRDHLPDHRQEDRVLWDWLTHGNTGTHFFGHIFN